MKPVSPRNRGLVDAARLHRSRERTARGQTLIEGPTLLEEALAAGVLPTALFALESDVGSQRIADEHQIPLIVVDDAGLKRLAGTQSPRGPVCVIRIPEPGTAFVDGLLVAWGVSDPGNVGTMIRTAAAFGWGFGHTGGSADPWAPKVLRAGAGAQFRAPIRPIGGLDQVRQLGFEPLASIVRSGMSPVELPSGRYAVLVGEEATGLPGPVVAGSAFSVTIPMPGGTESLNAAVAAGMILYELSRDRS